MTFVSQLKRYLPHSLISRMVVIIVFSMLLAQSLSSWFWMNQAEFKAKEGLESSSHHLAQSAASTVRFFERLPMQYRHIVLDQLRNMGGSRFFVSLNSEEIRINALPESHQIRLVENAIRTVFHSELGQDRTIHIAFSRPDDLHVLNNEILLSELPPSWASHSLLIDKLNPPILVIQIEMGTNEWLYLAALMPPPYTLLVDERMSRQEISTLILTTLLLILFTYLLFRWQTGPLQQLAQAASEMSIDLQQPRLKEEGASELVAATRAFNTMQQKMSRYIEDREKLFSSISHDLKTPITRLRLRTELLDDEQKIEKFNQDLDELELMVKGALQTVKETDIHENIATIQLPRLLQQVAELHPGCITLQLPPLAPIRAKPLAIKRCLSNLIDNGVKYGRQVTVSAEDSTEGVTLHIDDQGPGIPDANLEDIFQPYVRLHHDENGSGLGLGIARNIVHSHGGTMTLTNKQDGGLRVSLHFPRHSFT